MPDKAITQEEIEQAMYRVLDSYEVQLTFRPGLRTLILISGAAVVGNIVSLLAMQYTAKGLNKLAEKIQWETVKMNYNKSQGEENGSGAS